MKDQYCLQYQEILRKSAASLFSDNGYDKLITRINYVADWDEYQAFSTQINTTIWFKDKKILKEIEPELPHRAGFADILLAFSNQDIYCEVASLESLAKSMERKKQAEEGKIENQHQKLSQKQPWLSEIDIEKEIEKDKTVRNLQRKINKQLPPKYPGILVLETGRAMVYCLETEKIAEKIFKNKLHVILIMLWSLERGSNIGKPPFWFINPHSSFQKLGQELLKYLGQENKC